MKVTEGIIPLALKEVVIYSHERLSLDLGILTVGSGSGGTALQQFSSFSVVNLDGERSSLWFLICGVPQGLVFLALLLNTYMTAWCDHEVPLSSQESLNSLQRTEP